MNNNILPLGQHGDQSRPVYYTNNLISKHSTIFYIIDMQILSLSQILFLKTTLVLS